MDLFKNPVAQKRMLRAYRTAEHYEAMTGFQVVPRIIHEHELVYDVRKNGMTETVKDLSQRFPEVQAA